MTTPLIRVVLADDHTLVRAGIRSLLESFDGIMTGLHRQLSYYASKEQQFIPHPTTWLNQERWSDEPQPIQRTTGRRTIADAAREYLTSNDYRGDAFGLPSIGRH